MINVIVLNHEYTTFEYLTGQDRKYEQSTSTAQHRTVVSRKITLAIIWVVS